MYFNERYPRKPTDKLNLRQASLAIGKDPSFLSDQRSRGSWPKGIKLTRKRTALMMNPSDVEVLKKFYEEENK